MRKISILLLSPIFLVGIVLAQVNNVAVETNKDINHILSSNRFLFPQFQVAHVYLGGVVSEAKMNYNMLTDEMLFINADNDTLALANIKETSMIRFEKRIFKSTSKGVMERLGHSAEVELYLKRSIKQIDRQKRGAYGTVSNTTSIDNYTSLSSSNQSVNLNSTDVVLLRQTGVFYFTVDGRKYRVADRAAFVKMFSPKKNIIEEYLNQNPVEFDKEEDIIRLFKFCIDK